MRKIFTIAFGILSFHCAMAQNVGIGTTTPAMPLHIKSTTDTAIVTLENTTPLGNNVNTGLYFKNGNYFTGAVKAIGTGTATSRISLFSYAAQNQNNLREYLSILDNGYVGIGTVDPKMLFHTRSLTDTAVAVFENGNTMATGTNVGIYFKNGNNYTGALKTTATGANSSRLGLYSYAGTGPGVLKEYLSVLDDGKVGIGTTTPTNLLTVAGTGSFTNNDATLTTPSLKVTSIATSVASPAISGEGASAGVLGTSATGIGVFGISGVSLLNISGVGVMGQSANGQGVLGVSSKANSASVQGIAQFSNVTAGYFLNTINGGKALYTDGAVQISGQGAGAGKVLTSDASGNATWQAPAGATSVGFTAYLTNNLNLSANSASAPSGYTIISNDGGGLSGGTFTAPSAGYYLFTINAGISQPNFGNLVKVFIDFIVNGSSVVGGKHATLLYPNSNGAATGDFSYIIKMNTGDNLYVQYGTEVMTGSTTTVISGGNNSSGTKFSGVKL